MVNAINVVYVAKLWISL